MLLYTCFAILAILSAFIVVLFPAMHMHYMTTFNHYVLAFFDFLFAVMTDPSGYICFRYVFLVIFEFKYFWLTIRYKNFYDHEKENYGKECGQNSSQKLEGCIHGTLRMLRPRLFYSANRKITKAYFISFPNSSVWCLAEIYFWISIWKWKASFYVICTAHSPMKMKQKKNNLLTRISSAVS